MKFSSVIHRRSKLNLEALGPPRTRMDGVESVPPKKPIPNNNALEMAHEDKEEIEDMTPVEDMEDCVVRQFVCRSLPPVE